jgi:putative toxin-antitoxin system antitoxin component (TIGR02293 family)
MEGHAADRAATTESPEIDAYRKEIHSGRASAYRFVLLVGLPTRDPMDISKRIAKGLAFTAFEYFQRTSGLPRKELAELVEIAPSTLHRRKKERRLDPQESDRLLRASRVFGHALELFEGDAAAARHWLSTPQRGLGGQRPLALARTDIGAREVESLVDRLEQGVLT